MIFGRTGFPLRHRLGDGKAEPFLEGLFSAIPPRLPPGIYCCLLP
jgi:hypothetical protein